MKEKCVEEIKLKELREIKKILLENQTIMKDILKAVDSEKNRATINKQNENCLAKEVEEYVDPLFCDAVEFAIESGKISASLLQRKFKLGYARATRFIDKMEDNEIISGYQGSKPREVLISKKDWKKIKEEKLKI